MSSGFLGYACDAALATGSATLFIGANLLAKTSNPVARSDFVYWVVITLLVSIIFTQMLWHFRAMTNVKTTRSSV